MNVNFKDTRLVEAFDCIDPKYIAEVGESLKLRSVRSKGEEYKKQPFSFHVKQILALVGCLILLSVAFPTVNYAVKFINSFAASWESETTESSQLIETDEIMNSEVFKYVGKGMSIDEVYSDVLENGWVVSSDAQPLEGKDKWLSFLDAVNQGIPASVLIAQHCSYDFVYSAAGPEWVDTWHEIALRELIYDGKTFIIIENRNYNELNYNYGEYPYFLSSTYDFEDTVEGWKGVSYYLTIDPDYSIVPECEHFAIKPCYCSFSILYTVE